MEEESMFKVRKMDMVTNKTIKVGTTIINTIQNGTVKKSLSSNLKNTVRVLGKLTRKEVSLKYAVKTGIRRLANACRNKILNKSLTAIFI